MTHPITPPPELVKEWLAEPEYGSGWNGKCTLISVTDHRLRNVCAKAAQWGADRELDACCEWMESYDYDEVGQQLAELLRVARRPKPQTLNSIALQMLGTIERDAYYLPEITDTIRRALEALPE
jgi:hypothetical protein